MRDPVCVSAGRFNRPARLFLTSALAAVGIAAAAVPAHAQIDFLTGWLKSDGPSREVRSFYQSREDRPLWTEDGRIGPEAYRLLHLIETADLDGLNPRQFKPGNLAEALERAEGGSPQALQRAEALLSETFAEYVQAMRRSRIVMRYESPALAPIVPTKRAALDAAADAPSLLAYLEEMEWMHPYYAPMREALENPRNDARAEQLIRLNLERVRAIPANPADRYVLVDTAAARLYMYENGRVRDSMRVVVGKADQQTPMMAGFIRYAVLNPYWNVPPDLVPTKIAPGVLKEGPAYLKKHRYEILSDWSDKAKVLDPAKIDWRAAAAGRIQLRVRQLPGKANSMGNVKFMFPNDFGVYLHDTPDKHLLRSANRQFSSGCVRLEDAAKLGRWLFGKPLVARSTTPEQEVNLPQPVPVYITYLTAAPEAGRIAFRTDSYRRDETALALLRMDQRGTR